MKKINKESEAFNLHQKVLSLVEIQNSSTLVLGELFYRIKKEKMFYELCGDDKATWRDYLGDIKKSYGYASLLMNLYRFYILDLELKYKQLEGIDTIILDVARQVITKENLDEWLPKLKTLSRSDIKDLVRYGDKDKTRCRHEWQAKEPKWVCDKCGAITKTKPD